MAATPVRDGHSAPLHFGAACPSRQTRQCNAGSAASIAMPVCSDRAIAVPVCSDRHAERRVDSASAL